jgi:hypothetical protein
MYNDRKRNKRIVPRHGRYSGAVPNTKRSKTVISSSWRLDCTRDQILSLLNDHGFKGELHQDWRTPGDENLLHERGKEILAWLDSHEKVGEWIVLEDSVEAIAHFTPELTKRMIRPVSEVGLTKPALAGALKILLPH